MLCDFLQGLRLRKAKGQSQSGEPPAQPSTASQQQPQSSCRPAEPSASSSGSGNCAAEAAAATAGGPPPEGHAEASCGCSSGGPDFEATWCGDGGGRPAAQLLRKLRWLTVGPRYDWTLRVYDFENPHHRLPGYAVALARRLIAAAESAAEGLAAGEERTGLGTQQQQHEGEQLLQHTRSPERRQPEAEPRAQSESRAQVYTPDAALVCYYREGDTLCGHKDDVERDVSQVALSLQICRCLDGDLVGRKYLFVERKVARVPRILPVCWPALADTCRFKAVNNSA